MIISCKVLSSILNLIIIQNDKYNKILQIRPYEDLIEFAIIYSIDLVADIPHMFVECTLNISEIEQIKEDDFYMIPNDIIGKLVILTRLYPKEKLLFLRTCSGSEIDIMVQLIVNGQGQGQSSSSSSDQIKFNFKSDKLFNIIKPVLFRETFSIRSDKLLSLIKMSISDNHDHDHDNNNEQETMLSLNKSDNLEISNINTYIKVSIKNAKNENISVKILNRYLRYLCQFISGTSECQVYMSKTGPFVIEYEYFKIWLMTSND
jgi:hypothetical protein